MRFLIVALIVLLAGVGLALVARDDPGYLLVSRGEWQAETTLTFAVILILLTFVLLYFLIRFLLMTWLLPRRLKTWSVQRQSRKTRAALTRGLWLSHEGQWRAAEDALIHSADLGDPPLLHYLGAARAAERQGAVARRDHYLEQAQRTKPNPDLAVGVTRAEFQITDGRLLDAETTLEALHRAAPKHAYVLELLMKVYIGQGNHERLLELLPELRKAKVTDADQANAPEITAYLGRINDVALAQDKQDLYELWDRIPKRLKSSEPILLNYLRYLCARGRENQAEPLLRDALKKHASPALIYFYGLLQGIDPVRQLSHAEGLLKGREADAILLLTLARLSLRNRLWGKARGYFEASIGADPRAETYRELGQLAEQMNDPEAARHAYRQGLSLTADAVPILPFAMDRSHVMIDALPHLLSSQQHDGMSTS